MSSIDPNATIQFSDSALNAEVGGAMMVMDPDAGKYYGLNAVGSEILRRLAQPTTPTRLVADLIAHYDGPGDVIETETMDLLHSLLRRNLLVVSGPSS